MGCFCRLWFKSSEPKSSRGLRQNVASGIKRGCSGRFRYARSCIVKQIKAQGMFMNRKIKLLCRKTKFKEVKIYGQNQNETYRLP